MFYVTPNKQTLTREKIHFHHQDVQLGEVLAFDREFCMMLSRDFSFSTRLEQLEDRVHVLSGGDLQYLGWSHNRCSVKFY